MILGNGINVIDTNIRPTHINNRVSIFLEEREADFTHIVER
jgi:hypothetical protein